MKRWYVAAITLAMLLPACGGSSQTAVSPGQKTLTAATLRLDYFIGSEHAPVYYALSKGWYRDAGIDLTVHEGNGSTTTVKLVGTGEETFGLATADAVLAGRVQGIPDKVVGILYQRSPNVLISLKKSNINQPTDLYGKKVAIIPKSFSTSLLEAWWKRKNIDTSKFTKIPLSGSIAQGLQNDQFQAGIAYTYNDAALLKSKGVDVNSMNLDGIAENIYSLGMVASDSVIKSNPQLVQAFVSTTIKAYVFAEAHQKEVVDTFLQLHPQLDKKYSTEKFPDVLSYLKDPAIDKHCVGWMSQDRWQQMQKIYGEQDVIPATVPVAEAYTNQFVGCK